MTYTYTRCGSSHSGEGYGILTIHKPGVDGDGYGYSQLVVPMCTCGLRGEPLETWVRSVAANFEARPAVPVRSVSVATPGETPDE